MVGAGTFLNPLLKVVTTVAILAAIYFFMVRPILDTTENISGDINESVNRSLDQAERIQQCVQNAGQDVDALQACGELATRLANK